MKSNLDSLFKTDKGQELSGVWFLVTETAGFLVKRWGGANSKEIQKKLAKYYKPHARLIESGAMEEATARKILLKVFVESCIMDWKGIEIDGEIRKFDKTLVVDFLMELPDLADALIQYAGDISNFKEEDSEGLEEMGNS